MNVEEKLSDRINIGQGVLFYLFKLNSKELKEKIRDIVGIKFMPDDMLEHGTVTKTYINDEPSEIVIDYYDSIKIDWMGIQSDPENGTSAIIRQFDKFFTLDMTK